MALHVYIFQEFIFKSNELQTSLGFVQQTSSDISAGAVSFKAWTFRCVQCLLSQPIAILSYPQTYLPSSTNKKLSYSSETSTYSYAYPYYEQLPSEAVVP